MSIQIVHCQNSLSDFRTYVSSRMHFMKLARSILVRLSVMTKCRLACRRLCGHENVSDTTGCTRRQTAAVFLVHKAKKS
ncbi:MAG: hypothetical protein LBP22_11815 [Deltaproteobacteria bacterium]|nr:hypothetical protein [Deltaproteobacteria bacterium]